MVSIEHSTCGRTSRTADEQSVIVWHAQHCREEAQEKFVLPATCCWFGFKTDFVVVGENPGSKARAEQLGVHMLEKDFEAPA